MCIRDSHCLMGLDETVSLLEGGPCKALFEENEGKYIGRWQSWWMSVGRYEEWVEPPTPAGEDAGLEEGPAATTEA